MRLRLLALRMLPLAITTAVFSGGAVAHAASVPFCVPSTPSAAVTSPSSTGACATGSTAVQMPASSADQQTLLSILPDIKVQASGVGGKPTIQFSGVNLQLLNGSGSETTTNGEGNLVIGYDPAPGGPQNGSHNLVMGTTGQTFEGYGGIEGGSGNFLQGADGVVFGNQNATEANGASVLGGSGNVLTSFGNGAVIVGGQNNKANGVDSVITGGTGWVNNPFDAVVGGGPVSSIYQFGSGWSSSNWFGNNFASWYKDGSGIVHLQGGVARTSGSSNLIATLPPAARPIYTVYTIVHTYAGTYADLAINPDGTIDLLPSSNTNTTFVSLEGITYQP